jgi:hypothetical protein
MKMCHPGSRVPGGLKAKRGSQIRIDSKSINQRTRSAQREREKREKERNNKEKSNPKERLQSRQSGRERTKAKELDS